MRDSLIEIVTELEPKVETVGNTVLLEQLDIEREWEIDTLWVGEFELETLLEEL